MHGAFVGMGSGELADEVFEVDDILRYWKDDDGEECFLIKWYGYPLEASTWEPLEHLGRGCVELISEARSLFDAVEGGWLEDEELGQNGDNEEDFAEEEAPEEDIPADTLDTSEDNPALKRIAALLAGDEEEVSDGEPKPPGSPPCKKLKLDVSEADEPPILPRPEVAPGICCFCRRVQNRKEAPFETPQKSEYVCPLCRLKRVDDFQPPVGAELLCHTFSPEPGTARLSFTSQIAQWRKQDWSIYVRCVTLRSCALGGPIWPYLVEAKLNGKKCFNIEPPPHLHVRKEQCYNITMDARQGLNNLEFRFQGDPEKRNQQREQYCIGVVLTKQLSVASIVAQVQERSKMSPSWGKERVQRILTQADKKDRVQKDCVVTGSFGRSLKLMCPVSYCPIEQPAVGRNCQHLQVFDLTAYISVNEGIKFLDKRWTCPVCSQPLRPSDLVLDVFMMEILQSFHGKEEQVESIVFEADGSWSIPPSKNSGGGSGIKAEGDAFGGDSWQPAASPVESIDLSESE